MKNIGYPAPDVVDGHDLDCVQLAIPANFEHRAAFWGALTELTHKWVWDTGGDDEKATHLAQYWAQIIHENADNCGDGSEPDSDDAPYWDDVETVAGVGEGTQWGYESIADWAITAFLAVAGSPAAALFYKTTVNRARLAFQSMDAGAIVNVFIDGILALAIPTASTVAGVTEVIEADIDLVQFAIDHSLTGTERIIRLVAA